MKKSSKGALAIATAGVILLGGAGSLAYWSTQATADGGSITAGTLTLSSGSCDADWVYQTGAAKAGQKAVLFVPGDKITKKCTFTVGATGDNLTATVAAPSTLTYTAKKGTTAVTDSSLTLTNAATYALNGTNARSIANGGTVNSADNGSTLTATFNVTVPYGTNETAPKVNANDTQGLTATLDTLTVKLTQADPNAVPAA